MVCQKQFMEQMAIKINFLLSLIYIFVLYSSLARSLFITDYYDHFFPVIWYF